jgi:hypothetical protein
MRQASSEAFNVGDRVSYRPVQNAQHDPAIHYGTVREVATSLSGQIQAYTVDWDDDAHGVYPPSVLESIAAREARIGTGHAHG